MGVNRNQTDRKVKGVEEGAKMTKRRRANKDDRKQKEEKGR